MPSKNWCKVMAASSGRMVQGELETPSAMPIRTECKAMPVSRTWHTVKTHFLTYQLHTASTTNSFPLGASHLEVNTRLDFPTQ